MQTALSMIWTRVTDSISKNDNRYIKRKSSFYATQNTKYHLK